MAKATYVQDGRIIEYQNITVSDIGYLDIILMTDKLGVAVTDIPQSTSGSVQVKGVFELPATSGEVYTIGQKLYWNDTTKAVTNIVGNNKQVCYAVTAKTAEQPTVKVSLGG